MWVLIQNTIQENYEGRVHSTLPLYANKIYHSFRIKDLIISDNNAIRFFANHNFHHFF